MRKISIWYAGNILAILILIAGFVYNVLNGYSHFRKDVIFSGLPHAVQNVLLLVSAIGTLVFLYKNAEDCTTKNIVIGYCISLGGLLIAFHISYWIYLAQLGNP